MSSSLMAAGSTAGLAVGLTAYALQAALVLGVGLLLPTLLRLRDPRACLYFWQGLLLAVLALPLLQPEPERMMFAGGLTVTASWLDGLAASGAEEEAWTVDRLLLLAVGLGALVRLAWLGLGLARLRSLRRDAVPAALSPTAARAFDDVWMQAGMQAGTRARLLVSGRVEGPLTFGWRDPVVLLPAGILALDPEAQRGIVCHELLHVRRRDWLWALFEEAVRTLLWFHPAVWMLLARIASSREQVVDREVVRRTGSRRAYLEALRAVASRSWQAAVPGLPFFHRGHLRERVIHLCQEVPMSRPRIVTLVTTSAGLVALTAVLGILAFPMTGTAWAAAEPVQVEGDIQPPQPLRPMLGPAYPAKEKLFGIEGRVISEMVIDEQGKVVSVEVRKSSGNANLDHAAGDALWKQAFLPATRNGKPVAVFYSMIMDFKADD
ncbi:MAG TPA: M56 family metallopeptidase [Thermoanaerobaculia bacterium]|nr:M56 family metallopeptidase [Thermoanaerobaculia bacterium]